MEKIPPFIRKDEDICDKKEIWILKRLIESIFDEFIRRNKLFRYILQMKHYMPNQFSVESVIKQVSRIRKMETYNKEINEKIKFVELYNECKSCRPFLSLSEIGRMIHLDKGTVNKYLQRLKIKGFIDTITSGDPIQHLEIKTPRPNLSIVAIAWLVGEPPKYPSNKNDHSRIRKNCGQYLGILEKSGLIIFDSLWNLDDPEPVVLGPRLQWPKGIDLVYYITQKGMKEMEIDDSTDFQIFLDFVNIEEFIKPIASENRVKEPGRPKVKRKRGKPIQSVTTDKKPVGRIP